VDAHQPKSRRLGNAVLPLLMRQANERDTIGERGSTSHDGMTRECDVNVVRASTSDDHFFMVAPGIEFPVGGAPANPPTSLIKPEPTLDVAVFPSAVSDGRS